MFNETLKIACYGDPGSRKTLQAKHLIEAVGAENVGIISCESGLNTIRSVVQDGQVFEADSLDAFRKAHAWAKDRFTRPEQWVVVDGGSRVFQWVSEEIWGGVNAAYEQILLGVQPKELPDPLKKFAVFITTKDGINSQQAWTRVGMTSSMLINAYVKLPCSMYWTYWQEKPNVDQYTKGIQWNLDLPGKGTRDSVIGAFDFIFRLVSESADSSKAICRSTSTSFAKCRDDWTVYKVPGEIPAFNLARFVADVRGAK